MQSESWEQQFHSAAAAASAYVEFYESHQADFDPAGNYVPYSQLDGDLRAAQRQITDLQAANNRYLQRARDAEAQAEALAEALRPFSAEEGRLEPNGPDQSVGDSCQLWQVGPTESTRTKISYGCLRRARTALAAYDASRKTSDALPEGGGNG